MVKSDEIVVKFITPQGFNATIKASSVQVKTALGNIEILKNHAPLVALLKPGKLKIAQSGGEKASTFFYIEQSGVIEVFKNNVTVLADNGFYGSDLDEEALKRSEKELRKNLESNCTTALTKTLNDLNEVNEKLKIVEEIRDEATRGT